MEFVIASQQYRREFTSYLQMSC